MSTVQIASADEKTLETFTNASIIHRDNKVIVVLLDAKFLTDKQDEMLETEGLYVGADINEEMIKTTTQTIATSQSCKELNETQWLVTFEI